MSLDHPCPGAGCNIHDTADARATKGEEMRSVEIVAHEVLRCALSWEPDAKLLGNVSAAEIGRLAASACTSCPRCGAEPFVNIDCDVCLVASALEQGETP